MEEFLDRFPEDPRRGKVTSWMQDYDAHRLWRRLERTARKAGGLEPLSDIQRGYVEAYRALQANPQAAEPLFLEVAKRTPDPNHEATDRECVEAARHCGNRSIASAS